MSKRSPGAGFHAHVGRGAAGALAHRVQVILEDRHAAVITERPQPLRDRPALAREDPVRSNSAMVGLKGSSLLARSRWAGRRRRGVQVLGDGAAPDVQMTRDFAHRPFLDPVQAVNFVDLFRVSIGRSSFIRAERPRKPGRCSFQDSLQDRRTNCAEKSRLGRKPGCSLQDRAASGPTSQTSAAERFRSRATLFFTRRCNVALPVPLALLRAVALRCLRVRLQIVLLITSVLSLPLLPAVTDHLRVQRISPDLLPVVVGAALPLALRSAADGLIGMTLRRLKRLLAIAATARRQETSSGTRGLQLP